MLSSNNQHHTRSFTNMINNPTYENTKTYNRKLKIQLKNVMYPIFRKICLERDDIVSLINECNVSDTIFKSSLELLMDIILDDCGERENFEEIFDEWRKQCEELVPNYAYYNKYNKIKKIKWDSIFNHITSNNYYNACFMMFFIEIAKDNLAIARRTLFAHENFKDTFKGKMKEMDVTFYDMKHWKGMEHYLKLFY